VCNNVDSFSLRASLVKKLVRKSLCRTNPRARRAVTTYARAKEAETYEERSVDVADRAFAASRRRGTETVRGRTAAATSVTLCSRPFAKTVACEESDDERTEANRVSGSIEAIESTGRLSIDSAQARQEQLEGRRKHV